MHYTIAFGMLLTILSACNENAYKGTEVVSIEVKEEPGYEKLFVNAPDPVSEKDRAVLQELEARHFAVDPEQLTAKTWEVKGLRATASPETEEKLNAALDSDIGKKLFFGPEGTLKVGRELQTGGKWSLSGDTLTHYIGDYDAIAIETYRIVELNEEELILLTLYAEDGQQIFSYLRTE